MIGDQIKVSFVNINISEYIWNNTGAIFTRAPLFNELILLYNFK